MFTLVLAHANNFQDTCYRKQESPKSDFNWAAKCDFFCGEGMAVYIQVTT